MGDVIKMFGKGYGTSGVGQTEGGSAQAEVVAPGEGPGRVTGGAPVAQNTLLRELDKIVTSLRTAANRLINLPPPGVVPGDTKSALLGQYSQLEVSVRALADRAATSSDAQLPADVEALQAAAAALIDTIEATLRQVGVVGPVRAPADRAKWMLYGILALGVGVAGFAGYKAMKHSKKAQGTKRPVKTRKLKALHA